MNVFRRFLKDRRRGLFGWTVAMILFLGLQNAFYPSFKKQMADFEIPEGAGAFFGISDIPLTAPAGWLQAQIFAFLPVLMIIYAVSLGVRALATSEEDGTLELMLSNPVTRARVAIERYAACVALIVIVGVVTCGVLLATAPPLGLLEGVSLPGYAANTFGVIGVALLYGSISFALGAFNGRRALAISVAAALAVAAYLANGLSVSIDAAHGLRFVSPFHWLLGRNMLAQGIAIEALTLPFALAAVFTALGIRRFLTRDLQSS